MPEVNANTFLPPTKVIPGRLLITGITKAKQAVVSFTDSDLNTYVIGQCVYMVIPNSYGMWQMNGKIAQIVEIDDATPTFTIDIDSTLYDTFVIPVGIRITQPASMVPAGSRNLTIDNNTQRVPTQNLNNRGN